MNIAQKIISIGLTCKNHGAKDFFIFLLLIKKNPELNALIQTMNEMLHDLCINGWHFIWNDRILFSEYLWKDGIDLGASILSTNFIEFPFS